MLLRSAAAFLPMRVPFFLRPIWELHLDLRAPVWLDEALVLVERLERLHVVLVELDELEVLLDARGRDRLGEDNDVARDCVCRPLLLAFGASGGRCQNTKETATHPGTR